MPYSCGKENLQGFQGLLAFLYAVEQVNANSNVLSGESLGGLITDSCSSEKRAECSAYSFTGRGLLCGEVTPPELPVALGTVGYIDMTTASSVVTSTVLFPLNVTVATPSISAVSSRGHDILKQVPQGGTSQATVMVEVMKKFQWDFVSIIYSEDPYGRTGNSFFRLRYDIFVYLITDSYIQIKLFNASVMYMFVYCRAGEPEERGIKKLDMCRRGIGTRQ